MAKLNPAGNGFVYATYLGTRGADRGYAIAVDDAGQAHIIGATDRADLFPRVNTLLPDISGHDFVASLNSQGSDLIFSAMLAPDPVGHENGAGIAVGSDGTVYTTGALYGSGQFRRKNALPIEFSGIGSMGYVSAISVAASPTPVQPCSPRPNIGVTTVSGGPNVLRVTIESKTSESTPSNHLLSLQIVSVSNAVIDIPGGPTGVTTGNVTHTFLSETSQATFTVRRATSDGSVMVPLIVKDVCGEWKTFVGGGLNAFGSGSGQVGTITGFVQDGCGGVIPSARVEVPEAGLATTTDATGHFTLRNVPVGSRTVRTTAATFVAKDTTVTVPVSGSVDLTVTLAGGSGTVAGVVTSAANGQPIAGADLSLEGSIFRSAVTDASGRFTFTNVPFGTYDLRTVVGHFLSNLRPVTACPGQTVNVTVALTSS